ncbi:hypothetical protein [Nonomuraea longicatena]|uniref:WYL domain-containing protein n=1 Tax=Nonomuraea longicatena TaxID=83682 RepID=A0ABN1QG04_9ACTN
MRVEFVCKDPASNPNQCPAFYWTDRSSLLVQGWVVTDPEALAELVNLAPDETVVEIPERLFLEFLAHYRERQKAAS